MNMRNVCIWITCGLLGGHTIVTHASESDRFTLITPEEAAASASQPMLLTARSVPRPGDPVIEVVSPDINNPIVAPVPIRLRFRIAAPSEPKLDSFRALYGSFRIDITDRLKKRADLTTAGLVLEGADIPSGRHQIVLRLEDTQGRRTERLLQFEIKD